MPDMMDTGIERNHIDRGLTGDKIPVHDPAAAPVHTDAEAAGTPTSGWAVAASLAHIRDFLGSELRPDTFGAVSQAVMKRQNDLFKQVIVWEVALPVVLGLLAGWYGWPKG